MRDLIRSEGFWAVIIVIVFVVLTGALVTAIVYEISQITPEAVGDFFGRGAAAFDNARDQ